MIEELYELKLSLKKIKLQWNDTLLLLIQLHIVYEFKKEASKIISNTLFPHE